MLIGDVWPVPEKKKRREGKVLAEGEVTGHAHRADKGEVWESDVPGVLVLDVPEGATVKHEEHAPVKVPPGTWTVRQKREYDHLLEEAREVRD